MTPRRKRTLVSSLSICALMGCAGSSSPKATLRAYADALDAGDADRAWALLSDKAREHLSRESLARALREDPAEARQLASEIRAAGDHLRVHAEVRYDAEVLELVLEDGQWRIARDPLDYYGQATPRAALRSFIRAIERRRWETVLRFVPDRWKGSMTAEQLGADWEGPRREEIAELVRTLKLHLSDPIEQQGDRARLVYGAEARVEFVREGGAWKIADPD